MALQNEEEHEMIPTFRIVNIISTRYNSHRKAETSMITQNSKRNPTNLNWDDSSKNCKYIKDQYMSATQQFQI